MSKLLQWQYALRRLIRPAKIYATNPAAFRGLLISAYHDARRRFRPVPPTGQLPIEIDGKPCIWMAWTGSNPIPGYLQLCLQSIRLHNQEKFNVIVITPDNLLDFIPDPHPAYQYLSYVHRADYLRCELLHRYGGIYLDMDTLCFSGLWPWYGKIHGFDLVGYDGRMQNELFGMGMFGPARRASVFTAEWARQLRQILDKRLNELESYRLHHPDGSKDSLRWGEILGEIVVPLTKAFDAEKRLSFYRVGRRHFQVCSDAFTDQELFAPNQLQIRPSIALLILGNAAYPDYIKNLDERQMRQLDWGLASLIRQALV